MFPFQINCVFFFHHPKRVALPRQRVSWALRKLSRDREGTETCRWVGIKEGKALSKPAK